MKASETTVRVLLDGQKQYVVPLFQRKYSWRKQHWETLWQDIVELYTSVSGPDHFLGSVVTLSRDSTPESITPYTLVDGQQRLTTLCLLLAALRDSGSEHRPDISDRLHGLYLVNQYAAGDDCFKVLPTQADRDAFFAIIDRSSKVSGSSLSGAYQFFLKAVAKGDESGEPFDLAELVNVILKRLSLVSITLGKEDNPYRIFESLNAKGLRLTQPDLLRNYFFMRLPVSTHERLYSDLWKPMEDRLGESIEGFIRDSLVKDGEFVRNDDVYQTWKTKLDKISADDVQLRMDELAKFSHYYASLIEPEKESDDGVRKALGRLNRWGGTTAYPFVLNLYEAVDRGRLNKSELVQILGLIESFLVRRAFANIPTNTLNRIFIRLYAQTPDSGDVVSDIRGALSSPGLRWPSDGEFEQSITTYPLYLDSRPAQRKLVLEALEDSFKHKEHVVLSDLTIEHIMPQTLTPEWEEVLGPSAADIHRKYVHTLGNLTLTGYNEALSNHPFERKQQLLQGSHLELNREIAEETDWSESQIIRRAKRLAKRARSIWPGPETA